MIYKTTKTISIAEYQNTYGNNQANIDNELTQKFELEYPNHVITNKLGYLKYDLDGTVTYDLSITYELR